jgi:hypothetical protein
MPSRTALRITKYKTQKTSTKPIKPSTTKMQANPDSDDVCCMAGQVTYWCGSAKK